MVSLLEAAQPFLGADGFAGIRLSTRPDAVDGEILRLLQQYGVTAIELGVQSMNDRVLRGKRFAATPRRMWCRRQRKSGMPVLSWGCR